MADLKSSADRPERYPLDFETLNRGDVVQDTEIERISGMRKGTEEYRFFQMKLRDDIWHYFNGAIAVRCRGNSIQLLTGEEQDDWVQSDIRYLVRRFGKRVHEDLNNDISRLSDEARKRREDRLVRNQWKLQMLRSRKQIPDSWSPKKPPELGDSENAST